MHKAPPETLQNAAISRSSNDQGKVVQIVCIALMLALATLAWRIAIAS